MNIFDVIFCPILRAAVFSYPVWRGGQGFPNPLAPSDEDCACVKSLLSRNGCNLRKMLRTQAEAEPEKCREQMSCRSQDRARTEESSGEIFPGSNLSGPVRDTPPYRAIPFRDSIAEGGIAPICLVFIGYRAGIAEIPLLRGGIAPPLCMLSKEEMLRKGGGGFAPNWPC